jgi:SAM-dependent methyltransferase
VKDFAPSAQRNRDEILAVLQEVLPDEGTILELAAGTGQHAVHFAPHFPAATWQPSDRRPEALASIRAWREEVGLPNLAEPVAIDVFDERWPVAEASAIVAINCLHVAPWEMALALLAGAARTLRPGGPLFYYGAFFRDDRETAPSNLAFDADLRARDPSWGVRRLEEVVTAAESRGLLFDEVRDLPNNNYGLVLRRAS